MDAWKTHLVVMIDNDHAHAPAAKILGDWPAATRGTRPPGFTHTAWQLLEHLRICAWDINRYCDDPRHESPKWPEGYWPAGQEPPGEEAWDRSLRTYLDELDAMRRRIGAGELLAPLPHAPEHTLLRQAGLLANHNSYHLGQLAQLRKALEGWRA